MDSRQLYVVCFFGHMLILNCFNVAMHMVRLVGERKKVVKEKRK